MWLNTESAVVKITMFYTNLESMYRVYWPSFLHLIFPTAQSLRWSASGMVASLSLLVAVEERFKSTDSLS